MNFTSRLANYDDIEAIKTLMAQSMGVLLKEVLTPAQVAKSNESMGLDTQLLDDQTYFLIFEGKTLVGCGGWSNTKGRDNALADPKTEAAKIRAMYTHPKHIRRGIGRLLLELGESAAKAEGFRATELGATASGILLYEKCRYKVIEELGVPDEDGITVPIILMRKTFDMAAD